MAAMKNKNVHLTREERQHIEMSIKNGATKKSIADTLGKDKSTIGKEIKLHRSLDYRCKYPNDCISYQKCKQKYSGKCGKQCDNYKPFSCTRRDRSPGACNGCDRYLSCHYDKYNYHADLADKEYKEMLVSSRIGVNATVKQIKELGLKIKPLLERGQSVYAILQNHPEIDLCEKTLYNYIENGVFQDAGVSITCLELKRQVNRKMTKSKKNEYKPRIDRSHQKGRLYSDYLDFMELYPDAAVVEMDTVYNDNSNGPFIQTFKFLKYDLLFCIYHTVKTTESMRYGILYLEKILGTEIFSREVMVLLTDRGSEFTFSDETEFRDDGTRRTRIYYCDSMSSWQKGSIENVHIMLRDICPKEVNLYNLGLNSQVKADRCSSHINSYPKKKLNGKSSFQLLEFLSPDMAQKLYSAGLTAISPDEVTLKPYLLKK